ncbi:hypothetical protein [Actinoplanes sp. NPDC049118]|uniref:hypothetical protein n=1 Tax=Actinoplanes sp. NPDC049118 TaxID=3155769 RepID=UPI0033F718C5
MLRTRWARWTAIPFRGTAALVGSRTVCIYAQATGNAKKKIKCGSGTVTATYRPNRP